MYEFHKDKKRYFNWQYKIAKDYIIPFLREFFPKDKTLRVLEVGCAEAGVLKAFVEQGHQCTGIELSDKRTALALEFQKEAVSAGQLRFINKNIYDIDVKGDLGHQFDLIILKDVIEHIPNQQRALGKLKEFLAPDGKMFFGFPPWQMPFGGHQQICDNKLLKSLPWFHLLPKFIYKRILEAANEKESTVVELLEIKDTGISIGQFEEYCSLNDLSVFKCKYFFTNPIYQLKFGLPVLSLPNFLGKFPFIRNFYITAAYYVVG